MDWCEVTLHHARDKIAGEKIGVKDFVEGIGLLNGVVGRPVRIEPKRRNTSKKNSGVKKKQRPEENSVRAQTSAGYLGLRRRRQSGGHTKNGFGRYRSA